MSRNKNDADHWFDYGAFCLLIGDFGKVRILTMVIFARQVLSWLLNHEESRPFFSRNKKILKLRKKIIQRIYRDRHQKLLNGISYNISIIRSMAANFNHSNFNRLVNTCVRIMRLERGKVGFSNVLDIISQTPGKLSANIAKELLK